MDYHILDIVGGGKVVRRFRKIRNAEGKWLRYDCYASGQPYPYSWAHWDSRESWATQIHGEGPLPEGLQTDDWKEALFGCEVLYYQHHEVVIDKYPAKMLMNKGVLK